MAGGVPPARAMAEVRRVNFYFAIHDRLNRLVFARGWVNAAIDPADLKPRQQVVARFAVKLDLEPGEYVAVLLRRRSAARRQQPDGLEPARRRQALLRAAPGGGDRRRPPRRPPARQLRTGQPAERTRRNGHRGRKPPRSDARCQRRSSGVALSHFVPQRGTRSFSNARDAGQRTRMRRPVSLAARRIRPARESWDDPIARRSAGCRAYRCGEYAPHASPATMRACRRSISLTPNARPRRKTIRSPSWWWLPRCARSRCRW